MGLRRAVVDLRVCAPMLVQYQAIPCLRWHPDLSLLSCGMNWGRPRERLSSGERGGHAGGWVSQLAHSWASRSQAGCQREEGANGAVSRGSLRGCQGGGWGRTLPHS